MIRRDLQEDINHSEALADLEAAREKVAASNLVWHALLLPINTTDRVPRFVLTGHIVCHDCELCSIAGDFRDGGVLVPWRSHYSDCTDDPEEEFPDKGVTISDTFQWYRDQVTGKTEIPSWVEESLRAVYYLNGEGHLRYMGYDLDLPRLLALDGWGMSLPEVGASNVSFMYGLIDALFGDEGVPLPAEVHLPPFPKEGEEQESNSSGHAALSQPFKPQDIST